MAGNNDQAYSTLEPLPLPRKEKPLPTDLGKQVAPDDGKQHAGDSAGCEVDPNGDLNAQSAGGHHVQVHQPSRMKWILLVAVVSLVVIVAAVLGGVLGSRYKYHGPVEGAPMANLSNSSTTSPSARPPQRNIAALSYSLNSVNNTSVYFQDDVGQIIEAANSANNTMWSINGTGFRGKNGSAIAAAVSRPDFPLEISVFYLDVNNLIHDISYAPSENGWTPGRLSDNGYTPPTSKWTSGNLSDKRYTAMANSSLAAMYNQCGLCANTMIIAFQDTNGFIQIGNLTTGGWVLTQLGPALDPGIGTGLALHPFYLNGSADQINLYHQRSDLNMSLASWKPSLINVGGWSLNEQIYNTISSGSPIAAASSYSNVSTGFETWIEVLSISNGGVEVNTWSGTIRDWLEQYNVPSVMANSTSDKKVYGAVAVTATGNAFGVVKKIGQADTIENWQVADDMVDWSLVGAVDLGGVWG